VSGPSRRPFDLAGRLPSGVTSIEASAGTGKTYTLAGLATRYLAEGGVSPSELLIVTFTRAATSELRARVRDRMVEAAALLSGTGRSPAEDDVLLNRLSAGNAARRSEQLQRAITEFDAATITTIHGFATQVRQTLGATAGIDPDSHLVDDADELVDEVCGDILAAASVEDVGERGLPAFDTLRAAARVAAGQSDLVLEPSDASRGADPGQVLVTELVRRSLRMLDGRRRSRGTVSFDDVLVQLRDVLRGPGAAGVIDTLRNRFKVVLIDEFQDTDRVQWEIFSTLFGGGGSSGIGESDGSGIGESDGSGRSGTSLVLVGDPKQAIYRFRGADIGAYLEAVGRVGTDRFSLATNWRSDGAMLQALAAFFDGATFGDDSIEFVPVDPAPTNRDRRLRNRQGGDLPALVLRLAIAPTIDRNTNQATLVAASAGHAVYRDVAAYVRELLGSAELPPTKDEADPRLIRPSDIAVLVRTGEEGEDVQAAFRREGIPAVVAAAGNVLESLSALQLRYLLHAMDRPSDARIVRLYALSWFAGWSADRVATASDDALVPLQEQLADWAALFTGHPVADVLARVWADTGVVARVLGAPDGDRDLTDLDHLAELLHGAVPHGMASVAALLAVLDAEPEHDADPDVELDVAARRIESEAEAVQIMTIWKAKGLEFPVVCIPSLWRLDNSGRDPLIYTDSETGMRTFDLTMGAPWPDKNHAEHRKMLAADELAGERLRLLYVALTRAKHQTVVWWANAPSSGKTALAHVLFARSGGSIDPVGFAETTVPVPPDADIVDALTPLVARAPGIIEVVPVDDRYPSAPGWVDPDTPTKPTRLELARFETVLDRSLHRWSFSSMTHQATSGGFDPYDPSLADGGAHDEDHDEEETGRGIAATATAAVASIEPGQTNASPLPGSAPAGPLAHLPAGTAFGTLVHAILENVDFASTSLDEELGAALDEELSWSGLDLTPVGTGAVPVGDGTLLMVEGLRSAIETPLGSLFAGRRLADLAVEDRLNEVSFDMRLGQGGPPIRVEDIGRLVVSYLEPSDPLAPWAAALAAGSIDVELSGYLTGSIDLVARVRDEVGGTRFVVADYKTNQLTHRGNDPLPDDYGPDKLAVAMIEHHYPLQALLYAVAVHRYLRWRQPGYRPEVHLGGASYLFVRGMTGSMVATTAGKSHGVFNWAMAPDMVVGLSDLLDGRVAVGA
jgi:exodeoxyribonuclease V beta subunit